MNRDAVRLRRPILGFGLVMAAAVALPASATAAGDPGNPVLLGDQVFAVAPAGSNRVVATGSVGSAMLVQRAEAGGVVGAPFATTPGEGRAVAVQADGKVVVAGTDTGPVVRRFNSDGSLDTSFGSARNGTQRLRGTAANAVALGPCGSIVVGGAIPGGDGFSRVALSRLASDGTPDPTFGSGGTAVVDLDSGSEARGVAIQRDGKIVFAGQQNPGLQVINAVIARVNGDGTPDRTFANNGAFFFYHPDGGAASTFNAVAIDPSGRILGAGGERQNDATKAVFVRLTPNGAADATFGAGGLLRPDSSRSYNGSEPIGARSIAVAGNDRIVGAGAFQDSGLRSAALWVITPSGTLDPSVGSGGRVTTEPGSNGGQSRGVAVTPDGSIFAGGEADPAPDPKRGFVLRYSGFGAPPPATSCNASSTAPPPPAQPPSSTTPTTTTPPPTTTPSTTPTSTTAPPAGAAPAPPTGAVRLTRTALSPRSVGRTKHAVLSFRLSRKANVSLRFALRSIGRKRAASKCTRPTSTNSGGQRCVYYKPVKGRRLVHGRKGTNRVTLSMVFSGRRLKAGTYRLRVHAARGNTRLLTLAVRSR